MRQALRVLFLVLALSVPVCPLPEAPPGHPPARLASGTESAAPQKPSFRKTLASVSLLPRSAHAADFAQGIKKGAREFFWEFLDLALKTLGIVNVIGIAVATVRLWLHDHAVAKRRRPLRICPQCYEVIRKRNTTHCPFCRLDLRTQAQQAPAPPGASGPVRRSPAREGREWLGDRERPTEPMAERVVRLRPEDVRTWVEPKREPAPEPQDDAATREPIPPIIVPEILPEPFRDDGAAETTRIPDIRPELVPEPVPDGESVQDEEELEFYEWDREEQSQRRKLFVSTFLVAVVVGYLVAAVLFLFRLM